MPQTNEKPELKKECDLETLGTRMDKLMEMIIIFNEKIKSFHNDLFLNCESSTETQSKVREEKNKIHALINKIEDCIDTQYSTNNLFEKIETLFH